MLQNHTFAHASNIVQFAIIAHVFHKRGEECQISALPSL